MLVRAPNDLQNQLQALMPAPHNPMLGHEEHRATQSRGPLRPVGCICGLGSNARARVHRRRGSQLQPGIEQLKTRGASHQLAQDPQVTGPEQY
jgi:hypothetical protein